MQMDKQAAADMINTIIARLEKRIDDPGHASTPGEALCWEQAAGVVRFEAEMAGLEL
jgi:hypothetical protein